MPSMSFSVSEDERKRIIEYTKNKDFRKPSELIRLALFGYMRKYPKTSNKRNGRTALTAEGHFKTEL